MKEFAGHIFRKTGYSLCNGHIKWDGRKFLNLGVQRPQSVGLTDQDQLCEFCMKNARRVMRKLKHT